MIGANFASGGRIRHELYIDSGEAGRNSAIFEDLLSQRAVLEDAYRRVLRFEPSATGRAYRIADYAEGSVMNEPRYDEYVDWFFDAGERLRRALKAIRSPGA